MTKTIPINKEIFKFQSDRNVAIYKDYLNYKNSPNKEVKELTSKYDISWQRLYQIKNAVQKKLNSGELSL